MQKLREEAEELEKEASKGWLEQVNNGHNTIVLMHACKPTKFADGTVAKGPVKKKNPHAATEANLLARVEKGKRKAEAELQAPRKK